MVLKVTFPPEQMGFVLSPAFLHAQGSSKQ